MNVFISPFTTKNNLRINIAAKVFKKLDFALGKEESWFKRHWAIQGSVKTSQDLCLILRHISIVFQLKQV